MQKKTGTIFLLALMLFNIAGYRLIFSFLAEKATEKLDTSIDKGSYNEASLLELRIPLSIPYQDRQTDFERHYGEIMVEGKLYVYVKMKIDGDQIVLQCLPNINRQLINNTSDALTKANAGRDMEQAGKKQHVTPGKIISSDYDDRNQFYAFVGNTKKISRQYYNYVPALQEVLRKTQFQPPDC